MTFLDLASDLKKLIDKTSEIEKDKNWKKGDCRHETLGALRYLFSGPLILMNILDTFEKSPLSEEDLKRVMGIANGKLESAMERLQKPYRLGFVSQYQFIIEHLFKNLIEALNSKLPKGYWNISEEILKLSQTCNDIKHKTLNVLAKVRNTYHSNGLHSEDDWSHVIGEVEYKFKKDHQISCATWNHIITAMDATLDIIQEIYSCPKIKSLTDIRDKAYSAAQNEPIPLLL